jgi:hypothetical protein
VICPPSHTKNRRLPAFLNHDPNDWSAIEETHFYTHHDLRFWAPWAGLGDQSGTFLQEIKRSKKKI